MFAARIYLTHCVSNNKIDFCRKNTLTSLCIILLSNIIELYHQILIRLFDTLFKTSSGRLCFRLKDTELWLSYFSSSVTHLLEMCLILRITYYGGGLLDYNWTTSLINIIRY